VSSSSILGFLMFFEKVFCKTPYFPIYPSMSFSKRLLSSRLELYGDFLWSFSAWVSSCSRFESTWKTPSPPHTPPQPQT
jgi:hypothetical protein